MIKAMLPNKRSVPLVNDRHVLNDSTWSHINRLPTAEAGLCGS
jgi:hypothetical protein